MYLILSVSFSNLQTIDFFFNIKSGKCLKYLLKLLMKEKVRKLVNSMESFETTGYRRINLEGM